MVLEGPYETKMQVKKAKPPQPDAILQWDYVCVAPGACQVVLEISWEHMELSPDTGINDTDTPLKNDTAALYVIDVIVTEDKPKAGLPPVFWHGLYWDGTQTKATKPK